MNKHDLQAIFKKFRYDEIVYNVHTNVCFDFSVTLLLCNLNEYHFNRTITFSKKNNNMYLLNWLQKGIGVIEEAGRGQ